MISLSKRGRVWYVVGQVNNRRINQSLKTSDRTVAESLKRDFELQLLSGGRLQRVLWEDFQQQFLQWIQPQIKGGARSTFAKYSFVLTRFGRFLAARSILDLEQVQPATVADYAEDRRRDKHPTRGTLMGSEGIKSDMRILHRVFSYAVECGYLAGNPVRFRRLNSAGGKTMPFADAELASMLADEQVKSWPQLRAIVLTFLFTGLRISDVQRLPLRSLELKENRLIHKTIKRGKVVSLAIHPELAAALEAHLSSRTLAQQASPYVFCTKPGKVLLSLDAYLRRLFDRCGIQHGHAHRFRDTFAVRLLQQGASLYDVSKMLGINMATAEKHYSPYVRELQQRATRLIETLTVPGSQLKGHQ
jgi:site-specific recombinase XerD